MQARITIVILTFNQRDKTLRCLDNLFGTQTPPFDVVVWDNGSSDDTVSAISAAFPQVVIHRNPVNVGVAGGRNEAAALAIRTSSPTHLLFLDNDMELEPGFVGALLEPLEHDKRVGQTQAKLRFMADRQRLNDGGGCDISFVLGRTRPVGYGEVDKGQHDRVKACVACGGAMMVRTEIFQELGGFDTAFSPFGPEDLDFSLRLQKAGYKALFVPDAVAYHEVSHTVGADYNADYARTKIRHWLLFIRRHAPRWKLVLFLTATAPWLFITVLFRELRRGNLGGVRGLLAGAADAGSQFFRRSEKGGTRNAG